jgi:hypothetical protein
MPKKNILDIVAVKYIYIECVECKVIKSLLPNFSVSNTKHDKFRYYHKICKDCNSAKSSLNKSVKVEAKKLKEADINYVKTKEDIETELKDKQRRKYQNHKYYLKKINNI